MTDEINTTEEDQAIAYWSNLKNQKLAAQQAQQTEPVPESVQYAPPPDANRLPPKEAVAKAYFEAVDNGATSEVGQAAAIAALAAGAFAGDRRYLSGTGPTIFGISAE